MASSSRLTARWSGYVSDSQNRRPLVALSKEQLEKIRARMSHVTRDYWEEEAIVDKEIRRLTHGPFTLAEAIASGRPFRRKDPNTNGKWMTAGYLDSYDYADESGAEDYIATDYELYPLDKQNT